MALTVMAVLVGAHSSSGTVPPLMQAHEVQALTGAAAATLPPISFVPEALKTIRTRDVSGISLGMYSLFATGVALWLVYGVMLGEAPIYVANAITLALALAVLVMKLRYR